MARLDGVDGAFRTTQRGIDPGSYFGFSDVVHPGRDVIGWFVERIEPDELETYRDWLEQYAETIE